MSARLIDIGHLKVGMVLQDRNGNTGTITKLSGNTPFVEIDNNPNLVMWDWESVRDDVIVLESDSQ